MRSGGRLASASLPVSCYAFPASVLFCLRVPVSTCMPQFPCSLTLAQGLRISNPWFLPSPFAHSHMPGRAGSAPLANSLRALQPLGVVVRLPRYAEVKRQRRATVWRVAARCLVDSVRYIRTSHVHLQIRTDRWRARVARLRSVCARVCCIGYHSHRAHGSLPRIATMVCTLRLEKHKIETTGPIDSKTPSNQCVQTRNRLNPLLLAPSP